MNVLITGAAGFVARHMIRDFVQRGWTITAVDRNEPPEWLKDDNIHYIRADTSKPGSWQDAVAKADAVVNMAGKNIFSRWTKKYKQLVYDSRIQTTNNLVDAMAEGRPGVLCSTSAVGYYGDKGDHPVDESASPGDDFLARLSIDWEKAALAAQEKGVRVVLPRFALVMAKDGGALAAMLPSFRFFVGGPMSDGTHWMPWIHMDDLVGATAFVIENPDMSGPVNFAAPNPVRNREFAKTLGRVLSRPAVLRVPGFVLKMAMGELGKLMLNSQRAVPARLLEAGFEFQYPELEGALAAVLRT
ncbi:MAG: TIGR01777 family oxidoreductase [Desulfosalsimonas sp.]|uniref:TIGR01777 family oxidoreductase n=1 Tax=Desulfosalsimonas sp. TaxID=3073848 RepID=UPI003970779C